MQTILLTVMLMAGCHQAKYRAVPAYRTPYDSEWEKVKKCLAETANLDYYRARKCDRVWQLPTTTERKGRGDCTALATLLYQRMLRSGVRDGRIIFGHHGDAWHAWVAWRGYVLDPTVSSSPLPADWGGYSPCWGYDLAGAYRYIRETTAG